MTEPASDIRAAIEGAEVVAFPGGGGGGDGRLNAALARHDLNDVGNAERFIARFGHDCLFVRELGWHVWDGRRWNGEGGDEQVRRWAHEAGKSILEECDAVLKGEPDDWGGAAEQRKRADSLFGWSKTTGDRRRIEAMISEAAPYLTIGHAELDAEPQLINLENGTLRVEGACDQLLQHRREDHLSKIMPVSYDPKAECPLFDAFFARVQPDPDIRAFLMRWAGYSLTGWCDEECLVFHYGGGANGKSTFVELIGHIFGPYTSVLQWTSLSAQAARDSGRATPDMAKLRRARYVYVSEPKKGDKLDEGKIKWITGQDTITARALYGNEFQFRPEFKITLLGNHKPQITGQDEGIWRRVRLVPWLVEIPEAERDGRLKAKLQAEASGVLNHILDGLRDWLEGGLRPPETVQAATAAYRAESDTLGQFLAACVVRVDGWKQTGKEMYEAYTAWCEANAIMPWTGTGFGRALSEPARGFEKDARSGVVQYLNVRLVNVPERVRKGAGAGDAGPPPGHPAAFGEQD